MGLEPGQHIRFEGGRLIAEQNVLKRFTYVVLGDADTRDGLLAPYDEEDTGARFVVEDCRDETFFAYWRRNANSDLYSVKEPELVRFR